MALIEKPWGEEYEYPDLPYRLKELRIRPNCSLSKQFHRKKVETLVLLRGEAEIELNLLVFTIKPGHWLHINPGDIHRIRAGSLGATFLETSAGEDSDIVRLEDDYDRATQLPKQEQSKGGTQSAKSS